MSKEKSELIDSIREVFLQIKDKAFYNKSINLNSPDSLSKDFYEGEQSAYYHVMDAIITHIGQDKDLNLIDFGLENFNPLAILEVLD